MSHNQWYHSLTTVFCELPSQHRLLIPHPPDWLQALTLIPKVFIFYFIDFVNFSSGAMLYLHYDGYLSVSECRNICISYCVMATMSNNSHTQDTTMTWHMKRLGPSMYKCISAINASHLIALWVSKSTDTQCKPTIGCLPATVQRPDDDDWHQLAASHSAPTAVYCIPKQQIY